MSTVMMTSSVEETQELGCALAGVLTPGTVLVLAGGLGAGKTALAQGVAKGLGVTSRVTSPTFTMVATHATDGSRGISTMLHADLYRVGSGVEADDLAIAELVEDEAVALVEWGDMAPGVLGPAQVTITITSGSGPDDRRIEVACHADPDLDQKLSDVLRRWSSS